MSRRSTLKSIGALGASAFLGSRTAAGNDEEAENYSSPDIRKTIFQKVSQTPFIDTHEHLPEEKERLRHSRENDDWTKVLSHYINYDMRTAGMPQKTFDKLFSPAIDPIEKWALLEPFWPAVKNTGYGQAVSITLNRLYDVDELSAKKIKKVQAGYEKVRRPGFYKYILCDLANIESCQVNSLSRPFSESDMPTLLMQDLSILGMFQGPELKEFGRPTGIKVASLSDWHRVIDWWFNKYQKYAVAVKSQNAYNRDINYDKVPAEKVEAIFKKRLAKQKLTPKEKKALEDHLFWYAVGKATKANLPVKLHTGIYAGYNKMPLSRLINNPGSATDLCRMAPQTQFVFMHICYPYYEELIAAAKHYTNANVDMCWAWIINPVAAKDFLKKYLVTAPANKILTFGGDYIPVEPVLGHAVIARNGIALALSELVEEGWLNLKNALELIDPVMHGNARRIFNLAEKEKVLKNVKWG
ncbi:MAG: amidohydrolase family protein [Planctomycetota bacterium]|jgi:predicted TIM-barrel fold metal-dependent hydrolase